MEGFDHGQVWQELRAGAYRIEWSDLEFWCLLGGYDVQTVRKKAALVLERGLLTSLMPEGTSRGNDIARGIGRRSKAAQISVNARTNRP